MGWEGKEEVKKRETRRKHTIRPPLSFHTRLGELLDFGGREAVDQRRVVAGVAFGCWWDGHSGKAGKREGEAERERDGHLDVGKRT